MKENNIFLILYEWLYYNAPKKYYQLILGTLLGIVIIIPVAIFRLSRLFELLNGGYSARGLYIESAIIGYWLEDFIIALFRWFMVFIFLSLQWFFYETIINYNVSMEYSTFFWITLLVNLILIYLFIKLLIKNDIIKFKNNFLNSIIKYINRDIKIEK
jgi:hypothetical protein